MTDWQTCGRTSDALYDFDGRFGTAAVRQRTKGKKQLPIAAALA